MNFIYNGKKITIAGFENILEAIIEQGCINYQCKEGYCGSCLVKIKKGKVKKTREQIAYTPEGSALACCSMPYSDELEIEQ